MRQKTSHFLIGLFVITGALLIVLGVIVLGATTGLRQTVLIETCFDESVQGLENGSPMRLRGVKIGEVQEITFANRIYPTQHTYALVRVAVATRSLGAEDVSRARRAVQELITQGMCVRLAPQGITGNLYLESEMKPTHGDALKIRETTFNATPLPIYPFKFIIPIAGATVLLQGLSEMLRCVVCLRRGEWTPRLDDAEEIDVVEQQLAGSTYVDEEARRDAIARAKSIDDAARQRMQQE